MAETLHAHVDWYSVDCDGPLSGSYLMTLSEEEQNPENDFWEIDFHHRVVNQVVSTFALFYKGTLEVTTADPDANENWVRLDWWEQTEEGSRSTTATICKDPNCDLTLTPTRRDHRAEEAGY